jgi:hypothetical protein
MGLMVACGVPFLIICIFLFAFSFSVLDPEQYAILYDQNLLHVDSSQIYTHGGRYFTGLGTAFLKFNALNRRVQVPSELVRASDGLPFIMSYSYTYQVNDNIEDLYRFYLDFGADGEEEQIKIIESFSDATVRDVASRYTAFQYFEKREEINEQMKEALNLALKRIYCTVTTFQITNMEVNNKFAKIIEDTEVAKQEIKVAENEREKVKIQAATLETVAEELAKIKVLQANATAEAIAVQVQKESEALKYRIEQHVFSIQNMTSAWGLTTNKADLVLSYFHLAAIKESRAGSLLLGQAIPSGLGL